MHHTADDRDFIALTDALQFALAQQVLHRGIVLCRRSFHCAWPAPPEQRGRERLRHAQDRHRDRNDHRGPAPSDRARHKLPEDHDDRRIADERQHGEILFVGAAPAEEYAGSAECEGHSDVGGREELMWPVQVHRDGAGAVQVPLGPVPQPDAARGAHRHRAGGEPRDEQDAEGQCDERDHSGSPPSRSK